MRSPTPDLRIESQCVSSLRPNLGNARTHSPKQIKQIARSIQEFGFTNPLLVDNDLQVIAGHGRLRAAKKLGIAEVPVVRLSHLTPAQKRAYVLADNKLALKAGWDPELLAIELQGLADISFDLELTGFELGEIDLVLSDAAEKALDRGTDEDSVPNAGAALPTSRPGDLWLMGGHRLLCADARSRAAYEALMGSDVADAVFTDPPYNVPIRGHVSGLGSIRHEEFAMASGEMSEAQFTEFLASFLAETVSVCRDGAILFTCMDWRHMRELCAAGDDVGLQLKNLCVWNKDNAGMGSFYRSKHELVFVWKHGTATHTNTFELGQHGRHRTNVWAYAGVNTLKRDRLEELSLHPTVKPVLLVADAIRDVTKRNDIVLDPFSGSGTTIIAAEKMGRRGRAIELEPKYVDVAVRRWEAFTGKIALLEATGRSFDEVEEERRAANDNASGAREEVA